MLLSPEALLCAYLGSPSPARHCSQSAAAGKEVMLAWRAGSPSEGPSLPHLPGPVPKLPPTLLLAEVFG